MTASGMRFPAQQQASTTVHQGPGHDLDYVSVPIEGHVTGAEALHRDELGVRDQGAVVGSTDFALSAVPPSHRQPGWH